MKPYQKYFSACLLALLSQAAFAQAPALGTASNFAVLSALTTSPGVVTCTDSSISGDVGTASSNPLSVTQTSCTITGAIITPVSAGVLSDFNSAYDALAAMSCTPLTLANTGTIAGRNLSTLAGVTLTPGVYCVDAVAKTGVLTLSGDGIWIFKVAAIPATIPPTGALTGTNFSVVLTNGATACNVYWWVAEAVTMTTSGFQGTILAGAAITATGLANPTTPFNGDALAKAAVTLTNFSVTGCQSGTANPAPPKPPKQHCNQGVGNGPEGCDPGNSNQGNPLRSNDELRGTVPVPGSNPGVPGNPGRKGGNK